LFLQEIFRKKRKAEMTKTGVVEGIQTLRGFAAFFVVVTHASGIMGHLEYLGVSPIPLENMGGFGVAVFFVISGFIMAIVSLDGAGQGKISRGEFMLRRFKRIVPFMWICIIGYNIFTLIGTGTVEWMPALRAILLWPIGDLKPNVIWTLRHEAIFYVIFALTLLSARRRPWLLVAWLLAPLPLSVAASAAPGFFAELDPNVQDLINVFLMGRGANLQFGCGIVLGLLWLQQHRLMRLRVPGGALMLLAVSAVGALGYEVLTPILKFHPISTVPVTLMGPLELIIVTALSSLTVWVGALATQKAGLITQLTRLLGEASFSVYLVHNMAILALIEAYMRLAPGLAPQAACIAITLLATLFGIVVHLVVEKPLIRRLTRPALATAQPA